MEQLTREQVIAFFRSRAWEAMSYEERAAFQFTQEKLFMPDRVFHEALEKTLGRPVCAHEFVSNPEGLIAELDGKAKPPTFEQIIALLPAEKTVLVVSARPESAKKEQ